MKFGLKFSDTKLLGIFLKIFLFGYAVFALSLLGKLNILVEKGGEEKMPIVTPYQNSRRFSSTIGAGTGTGATFAIAATTFTDDAGAAATAFPGIYNYYNLYINGIMQTADTSSVTTTAITIPGGDALDPGTPLVVQFVVS